MVFSYFNFINIKMRNRRQNGSFNYYGSSLGYGPPRPLGMVPLPLAPLSSVSSISPYYVHETSGYSIRPPPFDQFLCDDVFPRPDIDETALTQVYCVLFYYLS